MNRKVLYWLMTAVLLAIGLNLLFIGAGFLAADKEYQDAAASLYAVDMLTGLVRYGVMVPILEELIFRGIVFKTFRKLWRTEGAVMLSALLFGIYHGNLVQSVYAFCLGLVLAMAYVDTDRLWALVLIHGAVNILIYLASSFNLFPEGSIALISGMVVTVAAIIVFGRKLKFLYNEQRK